ncbi:hypothetical protein IKG50_03515 [Candidatus Saccharibacteria bacterium]|nr:hypothetical protein [Candidatus Saccharibacteria bacterium]
MSKFGHTIRGKRVLLCILSVLILAGIGGTIAFVSEQINFNNKFSLSAENIDHIETFDSPEQWQPCQEEPKTVVTTNNSTHPVKVRLSYDEWWRNQADTENLPIEQDGRRLTTINFQNENDWELIGDWYYWKGELAPGASTRSLFKSVTLDCSANFAVQHVCNGTTCEDVHSPYEGAKYHINIIVQTTEGDFPHDDEYFNVSIDPNGGEFNGSSAVYTDSIQYGTTIDLSNITYTDHELVDWTLNGSTSYTDSRIRITNHTSLVANWRSSIFHNITVDPNGGSLDGSTEPTVTSVRQGEDFTLTDSIPTRDDYIFNRWDIKVGDAEPVPLTDHTFTVTDDATISAVWDLIIAQNTNTGEVYPSINSAIAAANTGETVLLLKNNEEAITVANDKNLTLDLGKNIVTGSLVNDGTLTLLNGEINNPDGIALTNNGTLTMGINDYKEDRTANINDDYVRLIGTTVGLKQNGTFNYYDGRIQGDVALDGGYDAAPSYRIAWDSEVVYFFPLVDHDWVADNQFTTLASADNAVSKTTVGGDIYYYDLQDNIDASSRTGYKIYIVRDFTAPYAITSEANTDVTIDLAGFDVITSDTITVNGKLTIEDSETTVETITREEGSNPITSISDKTFITPHNADITTIIYGGSISTPQTIINNNEFIVKNAYITGTSANDSIKNYATLTMENGVIGANSGYVLQPTENALYNLNENSYLYSKSSSNAAVYNTLAEFEWNNGNIYGVKKGITNNRYSTITLSGGAIKSQDTAVDNGHGNFILDGGVIEVSRTGNGSMTGITAWRNGYGTTVIKNGIIQILNDNTASNNINAVSGDFSMTGGQIIIKTKTTDEIETAEYALNMTGGEIIVNNQGSGTASITGSSNSQAAAITNNSTISISSYGDVYGIIKKYNCAVSVTNSNISVYSRDGKAYGIFTGNNNTTVNGSTITAHSDSNTSYGIYATTAASINSSKIEGGTYGIYADISNGGAVTLGSNDDEISDSSPEIIGENYALYGNAFNFYDGVLRGTHAFQDGSIKAIPDGTTYHIESSEDYDENCWLGQADNYLEVGGIQYNSLQKAYNAVTEEANIIKLIKTTSIASILPHSPADKEIIFDLNGHQFTITQPLYFDGTTTFTDSSNKKTGKLIGESNSGAVINNGNLTIESGHIQGTYLGVYNNKNSGLTMNGGTIYSSGTGMYSIGNNANQRTTVTINGGLIEGITNGISNDMYATVTLNEGGTIKSRTMGVNDGHGVFILDGGLVEVSRTDSGSMDGMQIYGNGYGSATIKKGTLRIINDNPAANRIEVFDGGVNMSGGKVEVYTKSSNDIYVGYYGLNMTGGEIIVNNQGSGMVSGSGSSNSNHSFSVTNGKISISSYGDVYGIIKKYNCAVSVTNSNISVYSRDGKAYGIFTGNNNTTVNGSTITAHSDSNTSYGIYATTAASINSSKIEGGTYGIYADISNGGAVTLGSNDDEISDSSPEIIGENYALYGNAFNFYDGVLRGSVRAFQVGSIRSIANNSTIYTESQTIDGVTYDTRYLIPEFYVAKIGTTKYTRLDDAIDAANTGDVIELLTNIFLFENITVPSEKNFTIETHNYYIESVVPITNNGKMRIINSEPSSSSPAFMCYGTDYFIINNPGGTVTLVDLKIEGTKIIYNKGTLFTDNLKIDSSDIAINNDSTENTGTNTNLQITSKTYGLYSNSGELIVDTFALNGKAYSYGGKLNLKNGVINSLETINANLVATAQNGDIFLDNMQVNMNTEYYTQSSYDAQRAYAYIVNNAGTLAAEHSAINYNLRGKTNINTYAFYNSGTASFIDSHITFDPTNLTANYSPYSAHGIYNTSGTIGFESGSIYVSNKTAYGIYNDTGTITLGVPEQPGPTYGKEDADVSTTDPDIKAIGSSTGIGVKNASGKVYFYDGRITGSSSAMSENPTATEYMFDPKDDIDENNYHFRILEWRREQPGN